MPRLFHRLNAGEPGRRLQFCEFWNGMIVQDPEFRYKILWSDEARFHLNGALNQHNCRYWRVAAPEITSEKTAVTVGVTVWCGMCTDDVVGPIFFDVNVNN